MNKQHVETAIDLITAAGKASFGTLAIFSSVFMSASLAFEALGATDDRRLAEAARDLTKTEAAHIEALFGDHLDPQSMQIYFHRETPYHLGFDEERRESAAAYVTPGNTTDINVVGLHNHSHDYVLNVDSNRQWLYQIMVHEAAHNWQNARRSEGAEFVRCDTYDYTLTAKTSFEDLCAEQQAEAIADYAIKFIYPDNRIRMHRASLGVTQDEITNPIPADDLQLARIVEEALPQARTARLRVQQQFDNAARCMNGYMSQDTVTTRFQDAWARCAARHLTHLDGTPNTMVLMERPTASAEAPILPSQRNLLASVRYNVNRLMRS